MPVSAIIPDVIDEYIAKATETLNGAANSGKNLVSILGKTKPTISAMPRFA